jgi:transposase
LSEKERDQLRKAQRTHRRLANLIYVRVTAILMLDRGYSAQEVSECLGIDDSSVYQYAKRYGTEGCDMFCNDHYVAYTGQLTEEESEALKSEVSKTFYRTAAEVVAYVEATFGVVYTVDGMVKLLKRLGFVYKKTRQKSIKSAPEVQQAFVDWLEKELKIEGGEIYFTDGVHPQHNTRPENGWVLKGECFEIEANTGRKRVNINGALSARDVTEIVTVEAETIDSRAAIELLKKLVEKHPNGTVTVICDNAPYNRSREVVEWLNAHQRVKMKYLPPYSANLNLIERLWKFMKKKAINSTFYSTFSDFREGIREFFRDIKTYSGELYKLLTLKFHIEY